MSQCILLIERNPVAEVYLSQVFAHFGLLARVEAHVREHDWLRVALVYSEALENISPHDLTTSAVSREEIGYALFRAAMQSQSEVEFEGRVRQAVENYENAGATYAELGKVGHPSALRTLAMTRYLDFWKARAIEEKQALLEDCWKLTKEALKAFEELGEKREFGITYNRLSWTVMFAATLDDKVENRERRIREAIEEGEKATAFLESEDKIEAARAAARTSVFLGGYAYYLLADADEKIVCQQRSLHYWNKAHTFSEETALIESTITGIVPYTNAAWKLGTPEALQILQKLLERARPTRDKFIIGSILDWLAVNVMWISFGTVESAERLRLSEMAVEYRRNAEEQFRSIGYSSILSNPTPHHYIRMAEVEIDPFQKRALLEKSANASREGLAAAVKSGHPVARYYAHSSVSLSLTELAKMEKNFPARNILLEEASGHLEKVLSLTEQLAPYSYFEKGLLKSRHANIRAELAIISENAETRSEKLREAIEEKQSGLTLCAEALAIHETWGDVTNFAILGALQGEQGNWLIRLFEISREDLILTRAAESFEKGVDYFLRVHLPSRAAECQWNSAKAYAKLGEHSKASEGFHKASENYNNAATLIPQLDELYSDLGCYAESWSGIERARLQHERQEFESARGSYETASKLLGRTRRWNHLASNCQAWAQIENGENFSKAERNTEAVAAFEKAIQLLDESKTSLRPEHFTDFDTKSTVSYVVVGSKFRREYCQARILIELGRLDDRQGNHLSSSEKYLDAGRIFEKLADTLDLESMRTETRFLAVLAKAWQAMALGEIQADPSLFLEASRKFEEAAHLCPDEKWRMLALGHGRLCKALESGGRFVDSGNQDSYEVALQNFESAAAYYARAGYQNASDHAHASKLLFDALSLMTRAGKDMDNEKKAMAYAMAEKVLLASADLFMKAGFEGKKAEVLRLVGKAVTEKIVALSLLDVLRGAPVMAVPVDISALWTRHESPVGLERFERPYLQARFTLSDKSPRAGGNIELKIEIINAGNAPARLTRLEGVFSKDIDLVQAPEDSTLENNTLNLGARVLSSLKTATFRILLNPRLEGFFTLEPRIFYLEEDGNPGSQQLGPVDILASPITEHLAQCFFDDYKGRKLSPDQSGWRTLMDIAGSLHVSRSKVYGDPRYGHTFSRPLELLIKAGIVESRVFLGERGRGGRVIKVRVCHDRGPVRRLIDNIVAEPLIGQETIR